MIQMAYLLRSIIDFFDWGCIQAGVVLFQYQFLTGVLLVFQRGEVLFKSGVLTARIRYLLLILTYFFITKPNKNVHLKIRVGRSCNLNIFKKKLPMLRSLR